MVSEASALSQSDSMPIRPTSEECLLSLSTRSWVQSIGGITKVLKSTQGLTCRFWIHFGTGAVCYVPTLAILRSPAKMEDLLSIAAGRSIVIAEKKVWKLCDVDWLVCLATENRHTPDSLASMLQEILAEPDYVHSNGPLSTREAACIFAEQAKALKYANDGTPHVAIEGAGGLYLYFPSLVSVWERRFRKLPNLEDLTATLYQVGFKALQPRKTGLNGIERDGASSLRMWRRRSTNLSKEYINGHD